MNCSVSLTKEDYKKCLNFILKLRYLWNGAIGDFRSSGIKRDIGKYIHDHMGGKLGEIAVQKFLEREFGLQTKVDFDKYESAEDYQRADIVSVKKDTWVVPKVKVDIKDTKPSSRWILIPVNLSTSSLCDYFIFVSVDMPLDQLILYFRDCLPIEDDPELQKIIKDFTDIKADVLGVLSKDELMKRVVQFKAKDSLPEVHFFKERVKIPEGLDKKKGNQFKFQVGQLGVYSFKTDIPCYVHSGKVTRKVKGGTKTEDALYIETAGDTVMDNDFFGEYKLPKGIHKVTHDTLSPLREDNYGLPIKSVICSEKDWRKFISDL